MTKTEAGKIARQARRYGYYSGNGRIWVDCPRCRTRVSTVQGYHRRPARKGEPAVVDEQGNRVVTVRDTVAYALDREMVEHLMFEGECRAA